MLNPLLYEDFLKAALREDLGGAGDVTTDAIVAPGARARAEMILRGAGRVAGVDIALAALRLLDPRMESTVRHADGADVAAGTSIASLSGSARAVLSAERVALNVLGRMCGIATTTRDVVASLAGTNARVTCTRKTTPLLRVLEKYAVRVGGGSNHRFGLDDAVLVKDNHIAAAGGIAEAIRRVQASAGHLTKVEVEVDTLDQLRDALALGIDTVLLDNMDLATLREAVALCRGRAITEASGGITPQTARAVAETGVDLLSLGWLTHSVPALDVALDITP